MRGVYLSASKVTSEQLAEALSLEGAIMPDNERMRLRLRSEGQGEDSEYYYYQVASEDSKD